jgi:hypothetical protein
MVGSVSPMNSVRGEARVLVESETIAARVKFRSPGKWRLGIDAMARRGSDGRWPSLQVKIDAFSYAVLTVDREDATRYWIDFKVEPGFSDIQLSLLNGGPAMPDPFLIVANLEIVPQ